jgi:hypothetical protein
MSRFVVLACAALAVDRAHAQGLHPVVSHMPAAAESSIEAVARYIAAQVPDPIGRAKALHDWVADRIAYDVAYETDQQDADSVFRNRRGVCAGYSRLLAKMASAIDLPLFYTEGFIHSPRGLGQRHAWNVLKLGNAWYAIDVTWDAGMVAEGKFVKRYSTRYFLPTPWDFRLDHSDVGPPVDLADTTPLIDEPTFDTWRFQGAQKATLCSRGLALDLPKQPCAQTTACPPAPW